MPQRESPIIAIDFDGTLVRHEYPDIGEEAPGAVDACHKLQNAGYRIILLTMRSGEYLREAVEWCQKRGITLWGVNFNPDQHQWTDSAKVYAHYYIDDAAVGCPLISPDDDGRPYVDWEGIEDLLPPLTNDYDIIPSTELGLAEIAA